MKWTTHYSRRMAEALSAYAAAEGEDLSLPISEIAIISISDPRSEMPRVRGWHEILPISFHDITQNHINGVVPNEDHAKQIVAFIERNSERSIVAHCEAGLSRSAAVCKLLVHLGWEYRQPHQEGLAFANPLLYHHLRNVSGGGLS